MISADQIQLSRHETPIFIGIEAILHWPPAAHTCIIIEPSRERASLFLKQNTIENIPDNISLVTGELGETPIESNQILETALIIFKLMNLEDHLFQANKIYETSKNPFLENLTKNIQLLLAAKKFHAEKAHVYAEISSSPHKAIWGAICNTEYVYQFLQRSIGYQTDTHTPFYLPVISANDTLSEIYIQTCNQLLQWLKLERPEVLTWSNNTIFNSVGAILFFWEMFRKINIPTRPVFTDYFFMQSLHLEGGIYFHLQQQLLPKKENTILSIYPYDAGIDAPKEVPVHLTPFHFTNKGIRRQAPLVAENDFDRDIAIIHHSRINTIRQNEINELYELSYLISDKRSEIVCFSLLNHFYTWDFQNNFPFNTYAARHLIRFLFFNFYSQIKIRQIRALVPTLSKKWKINLYGENWEELFGKQFTVSKSLSSGELQNIYQTSLVTIDFTPMYTLNPPNLNCCDCIHSGGMPLLMQPLLSSLNQPISLSLFDTAESIDALVTKHKDLACRQQSILGLQKQIDIWQQNIAQNIGQSVESLTTDKYPQIALSSFVNKASQGYFLFLLGFFKGALDKWEQALEEEIHIPLVLRFVSVGVGIHEYSKSFRLLEKALKKHPNHAKLNEFHQKLSVKMG